MRLLAALAALEAHSIEDGCSRTGDHSSIYRTGLLEFESIPYLELYMAVHNCKDLKEEQVLALQELLTEKPKRRPELQKTLIMAD